MKIGKELVIKNRLKGVRFSGDAGSRQWQAGAGQLGGSDGGDWEEYTLPDELHYADKGGHLERSLANDTRRGKSHSYHLERQGRSRST